MERRYFDENGLPIPSENKNTGNLTIATTRDVWEAIRYGMDHLARLGWEGPTITETVHYLLAHAKSSLMADELLNQILKNAEEGERGPKT